MHRPHRRTRAVADVWHNHNLRRLTSAWGAFFLIDSISWVAVSVWGFQAGGAAAVGLLAAARLLPGAIALPFGAWAADRYPRRRVAVIVFTAEAATLVGVAVAMVAGAPVGVVAMIVGSSSVALTPYRPAHLALIPLAARSPEQLVAANVAGGAVEGVATLTGPLLAGLLLVAVDPWVPTLAAAGAAALGVLAVSRLDVTSDPSRVMRHQREATLGAVARGFQVLWRDHDQATIVACFVMQLFVRGLLSVLVVLVALDQFGLPDSGVGWLSAAMGAGALIGAAVAVTLTGRRRLATPMAVGLLLWGAPIAAIGLVPHPAVAAVALVVVGVGNSVLDVAGFSLLQRMSDDVSLGRVFGALFTVGVAISAGGAALAAPLTERFGLMSTLVLTGLLLPLTAVAALPRLRRIDTTSKPPAETLEVLIDLPLFHDLPPATLEKLASRCGIDDVAVGTTVVNQGDVPDHVYVLVDAHAEVVIDGEWRATLGPGDHFGEIAVLGGGTRTATVRIVKAGRLLWITGRDFTDAVIGNHATFALTNAVIERRSTDAA